MEACNQTAAALRLQQSTHPKQEQLRMMVLAVKEVPSRTIVIGHIEAGTLQADTVRALQCTYFQMHRAATISSYSAYSTM
jgi:hypothetical protein